MKRAKKKEPERPVVWQPQKKQSEFMSRPEYEALYGGAAGGGKSDALLVEALRQVSIPHYRAIIFRKTYPELKDLIDRSYEIYKTAFPGARFNASTHIWSFPSGAKIEFGAMQYDKDKKKYQGRHFDFIGFDELTHFSWEEYSYMFSRNRPSKGVKSSENTRCYIRAATNPGGVGHGWVKARFVDAGPPMTTIWETGTIKRPDGTEQSFKRDRIFVPATVFDNEKLLEQNPDYLASLAQLPEKEKNALLYGAWDAFEGQYYTEFRTSPDAEKCREAGITTEEARAQRRWTHVIDAFDLNARGRDGWKIYRSYDFGYAKPFSCAWWAIDYEGTMYRILELYGCTKVPNEGVKWTPDEQFKEIARIEREHPWLSGKKIQGVADPAIWDASRGESVAETAMRWGIHFEPGDHARLPGLMQTRYRLQFDENGYPRMYVFDNCKAFIRTIPLMMFSSTNAEDLDSSLEDHCCDEWRYFCMMRPVTPMRPAEKEVHMSDPLDQLAARKRRR